MTLSDSINRAIEIALTGAKITSASPGHVNNVFLLEEMDHTNIDDEVRRIVEEEINLLNLSPTDTTNQLASTDTGSPSNLQKEINEVNEEMDNLLDSSLGSLANLTREQANNLASFSKDPFTFMLNRFF